MNKKRGGFTLIELLVVIAIISLLSSVVMAALNNARAKSRDARRLMDMRQIVTALHLFYDKNDCLPRTTTSVCPGMGTYSQGDSGGWDYSSQGGDFMTFLKNGGFMTTVPVDPINNMTGDSLPVGSLAYRYYCYADGPSLQYWKETPSWQLTTILSHSGDFTCK